MRRNFLRLLLPLRQLLRLNLCLNLRQLLRLNLRLNLRQLLRLNLCLLPLLASCDDKRDVAAPQQAAPAETEQSIRRRLGVPDDAETVMIFAQTSHLDLDWRRTFDEYYGKFVGDIFFSARKWLDTNSKAQYSIAEMAFLQHHLALHDDEVAPMKAHVQRGALRIVGGGLTSPDTLLPQSEMLARDFLYGIQFAEDVLGAKVYAAWLPDSFGHAATVPDWLAAAQIKAVAFARIDGAPSLFEALANPGAPFLPGSTAEKLQAAGSNDFVWQGPGGGTVIGHYLSGAGMYCQGDDIDYEEVVQAENGHTGTYHGKEVAFTDAKIAKYHKELAAWSQTPYQLVPVGCDFEPPKADLPAYLKGYNERQFALTRTWAVAGSFEDYAKLVSFHAAKLPKLQGDLAPVYMGYFGSRGQVKRAVRQALQPFLAAEMLATRQMADVAAPALQKLARSDHHDFVAGTATDEVVAGEQLPLLQEARTAGEAYLRLAAEAYAEDVAGTVGAPRVLAVNPSSLPATGVVEVTLETAKIGGGPLYLLHDGQPLPTEMTGLPGSPTATVRVQLDGLLPWQAVPLEIGFGSPPPPTNPPQLLLKTAAGLPADASAAADVTLDNGLVRAQFVRDGGQFVLQTLAIAGQNAIAAPSLDLADYDDMGGMWRLGHEMAGCTFAPVALPADTTASVQIVAQTPLLVRVRMASQQRVLEAWLGAGDTTLQLAVETRAPEGRTRTARLRLATEGGPLELSEPFGYVAHAGPALYQPTFWPAVHWLRAGNVAVGLRQSAGVAQTGAGLLELMVARDVRAEKCDVMGATGSDAVLQRVELRFGLASDAVAADHLGQAWNSPPQIVAVPAASVAAKPGVPAALLPGFDLVSGPATVLADKPAERGGGRIVRVLLLGDAPVVLQARGGTATSALQRVDLAERDLGPIAAPGGKLTLMRAKHGAVAAIRY